MDRFARYIAPTQDTIQSYRDIVMTHTENRGGLLNMLPGLRTTSQANKENRTDLITLSPSCLA